MTTVGRPICRRAASWSSAPGRPGSQLAEELFAAGREVVLSVGHCGRVPRRYRGRDFFRWLRQLLDAWPRRRHRPPDRRPAARSPARFACNPHLSGHDGGHDTTCASSPSVGSGSAGGSRARMASAPGSPRTSAPTWRMSTGSSTSASARMFDRYIERAGIDALPADAPHWSTHEPPELTELDLAAEGISTVLWTSGYAPDYGWLDLPILDGSGLPRHVRGVTEVPGLTALGLLWQHNQGSANLAGVAMDAEYLAATGRDGRGADATAPRPRSCPGGRGSATAPRPAARPSGGGSPARPGAACRSAGRCPGRCAGSRTRWSPTGRSPRSRGPRSALRGRTRRSRGRRSPPTPRPPRSRARSATRNRRESSRARAGGRSARAQPVRRGRRPAAFRRVTARS